ncbi:hypothetical protein ONZ45_g12711 [Pleurotus djamor]|nr:hypothetical protein ONZ45_g12711 [Pleurotus djamor]
MKAFNVIAASLAVVGQALAAPASEPAPGSNNQTPGASNLPGTGPGSAGRAPHIDLPHVPFPTFPHPPEFICPNPHQATPFNQGYHDVAKNHFYTTSVADITAAGYEHKGSVGRVYEAPDYMTVPLFHLYNAASVDSFYTNDEQERDEFVAKYGYTEVGVAGHVFLWDICGSTPLYRLYNQAAGDHKFTVDQAEIASAETAGYAYEGVAAYVYN